MAQLTGLGEQLKAAALQQQPMMGIPGQSKAPAPASRFNFDRSLLNSTLQPEWQNGASAETGMAPNDMAGRWQRFTDASGKPMVAWPIYGTPTSDGRGQDAQITNGPLTGWQVFEDPGDMGGGWLGAGHESRVMNGRPFETYDASGNLVDKGTFKNWQDDFLGPAGALAVLAMPFAAAAAGIGGAAGAAGAAGAEGAAAAGSAGASGAASAAAAGSELGAGAGGFSGWSLGGLGNELAAQGIIDSGAGLFGDLAAGAAGGAAGETLSKAALDGTNVFGANSAPGALDISALSAAAPGIDSANALTKITEGLGYTTPAVPTSTPSTPPAGSSGSGADSLIPGVSDSLLGTLGTTALGALGGSGSTAGGSNTSLQDAENARQAKVQAAVDAINKQFGYGTGAEANKAARESMYGDISGAVRDTAMRDVDRQYGKASKANTFGLARSGLLGGSVDAEAGGELQDLYGEGRLKATQAGLGAASDLRLNDEKSRQNLISLAQTGLDTGSAASMAAGQMGASADLAKSQASGATVGRLFDDLSQAYVQNQTLKARYPNGLPQQTTSYGSGNLFGTSRYTGSPGR